ncbi:hypothetical protein FHU30_000352 [Actinomadura rupiterrae]|nr:hypothetical protein [Actinomadura rupiterrae]
MRHSDGEWIKIAGWENVPGAPHPMTAVHA